MDVSKSGDEERFEKYREWANKMPGETVTQKNARNFEIAKSELFYGCLVEIRKSVDKHAGAVQANTDSASELSTRLVFLNWVLVAATLVLVGIGLIQLFG